MKSVWLAFFSTRAFESENKSSEEEIPRTSIASSIFMCSLFFVRSWSKTESASLIAPSADLLISVKTSSSQDFPSSSVTLFKFSFISSMEILLKLYFWDLERIVVGIFCISVVASIKIKCLGGSSKIFKSALKAPLESIWTSSIM